MMKKRLISALLCCLFVFAAVSCGTEAQKPAETTAVPSASEVTETQAATKRPETAAPVTLSPGLDETEFCPRLTAAYRKNDSTVLFTFDSPMLDPDGNLATHIYIASTEKGEAIARAVSTDCYNIDNGSSATWGANFEEKLPDKFFLCFAEAEGEGNGDADLGTVLTDAFDFGLYGNVTLDNGKHIAAIETGSTPIEAELWIEIPLDEAEYSAPSTNDIRPNFIAEGIPCTLVNDPDGSCEFTFNGTALRLEMLCNVQNGGKTCFNVPALIMYLDGEEYTTISMTDPEKYTWDNKTDIVFEEKDFTPGEHTVKFVNTTEGEFTSAAAYYCSIAYMK